MNAQESVNVLSLIGSERFLGAVFSTVFIILVGFFLRKKKIVSEAGAKILSSVLLSAALPALAFNAFMTDVTKETFTAGVNVLIFGFIAYVLLILLSELFYIKVKGDRRTSLSVLTTFGSTTFFGIPIINGFLGSIGTIYANIFNIAYRVFLYSYALIRMSGMKFEKKNLKPMIANPIIISTFVGLLIWLFQGHLPQVAVTAADGKIREVAFLRIDQTLPWLFKGLKYLGDLSSPLAWLAIGMTLANISLKEAVSERFAWIYSVCKLLVIPAVFMALMIALRPVFPMNYEAILAIIIMLATPPATVAVAYAIRYDRDAVLASNCSLLSTVLAVLAIVFWVLVGTAAHAAGLF